jgi:phosphoglycolate phosphatase-like HAD superfamily hydrolase
MLVGCRDAPEPVAPSLGSWSEGPVKAGIYEFVDAVTDPSRTSYVNPDERIAVFDLDGTMMIERPLYVEVMVAAEKLRSEAKDNPALAEQEPYRSLLSGDHDAIRQHGSEIVMAASAGDSLEAFGQRVRSILSSSLHPTLERPYSALFYAPMSELMDFLRSHEFRVYVVSQSQQEYIRAFADSCLGVESSFVIGSMIAYHWDETNFMRGATFWEPHNAREGKVLRIRERTGGTPIFAFGNSGGDRYVMEAAARAPTSLVLLLDHDDDEREFVYHDETMLALATERDWGIVSVKRDFEHLFRDDCLASNSP